MKAEELKKAIEKTAFAVWQDSGRDNLTGLFFDNDVIIATDGHRLVKYPIEAQGIRKIVANPKQLLKKIKDLKGEIELVWGDDLKIIQDGEIVALSELIKMQYPNWELVWPKDNNLAVWIDKEILLKALKAVLLTAKEENNNFIKMSFSRDRLIISAETSHSDYECKTEIDIKIKCDIDLTIGFNCQMLIEAVKSIDEDKILFAFKSPLNCTIINNTLLMPLKPKDE